MLCFAKENGFGKSWKFLLATVRSTLNLTRAENEKKTKHIVAAFYSEANEDSE